jgi:hypothetical protein
VSTICAYLPVDVRRLEGCSRVGVLLIYNLWVVFGCTNNTPSRKNITDRPQTQSGLGVVQEVFKMSCQRVLTCVGGSHGQCDFQAYSEI